MMLMPTDVYDSVRHPIPNGKRMFAESQYILIVSNSLASVWVVNARTRLTQLAPVQIVQGEEALAAITDYLPALVVIDGVTMSHDHIGLIHRLHQQQPELPLIFTTAAQDSSQARDVLLAGATDYVQQSLDWTELLSICRTILNEDEDTEL